MLKCEEVESWKASPKRLMVECPLLLWDLNCLWTQAHSSSVPLTCKLPHRIESILNGQRSQRWQKKNKFDMDLTFHCCSIAWWIFCDDKCIVFSWMSSGHPRFCNQLSNGLDIVSMAGEWLTAAANTNMFTYEIAPVFILMEHECLAKMREIIGFESGDSILAPGTTSNECATFSEQVPCKAFHRTFQAGLFPTCTLWWLPATRCSHSTRSTGWGPSRASWSCTLLVTWVVLTIRFDVDKTLQI